MIRLALKNVGLPPPTDPIQNMLIQNVLFQCCKRNFFLFKKIKRKLKLLHCSLVCCSLLWFIAHNKYHGLHNSRKHSTSPKCKQAKSMNWDFFSDQPSLFQNLGSGDSKPIFFKVSLFLWSIYHDLHSIQQKFHTLNTIQADSRRLLQFVLHDTDGACAKIFMSWIIITI